MSLLRPEDTSSTLKRVLSLDERVRKSELFPRIRDAEQRMLQNEIDFQRRRELERKQRERRQKVDVKSLALQDNRSPVKQRTHFFTGFVLNKDPAVSKYMPFDEIYFPKLFNKTTASAPPESIDSVWMLGFEDHIQRERQPKEKVVQTGGDMKISALGADAEKARLDTDKEKKKSKYRFVGVYSNGMRDTKHAKPS